MKAWVYRCVFGGWGTKREDWGVIQSLHKWIWLIEAASDPDWYTAGAPLIGEGEEWRRKWIGKRKGEYGPQRKNKKAPLQQLLSLPVSRKTFEETDTVRNVTCGS